MKLKIVQKFGTYQDDRYKPENERNSGKLLDRDATVKINYSVGRAGYPAYKSLTPPGQGYTGKPALRLMVN